ncbi:MAG: L-seryl-tRNA(Sec) selenium transferase [Nitrospirae bacterium]|nr:L-seryl-tRNA(Sec) selenium transferase [Nitrospirota bacterium]
MLLSVLPSVDEVLKSPDGTRWLSTFRRKRVLQAIRSTLEAKRALLLNGRSAEFNPDLLANDIEKTIHELSAFSLTPVINATGIVIHTNLGRAILSEKVLENVLAVSSGYSNLEYDLESGKRGKRHTHTTRLLKEITGAEDALIVNNNAAAVLLCLNTLATGREVVVSRGELVEIGGSFRVPDVMAAGNALLREVGTTNKTHLRDYIHAINEHTGLLLKVHQSNYKIIGFTDEVKIEELVSLGRRHQIPVMYDLGSGCLLDLKPYGIYSEPSVKEIVKAGVDVVSFSGDKLLGGPQGGIIAGRKEYLDKIRRNPLARAVRADKLAIAAFEATFMAYIDEENAIEEIPTLHMLVESPATIRSRANKIASALRRVVKDVQIEVIPDSSKAGGGSLPEVEFPTFAVSIRPVRISVNELETRLRKGITPVIARIKDDSLLLDARTIQKKELGCLVTAVVTSLSAA